MRKFLMGFVWFVALYIGGAAALGFFVALSPEAANLTQAEISQLAAQTTAANVQYIALAALALAAVGSATGFLPGTKSKPKAEMPKP